MLYIAEPRFLWLLLLVPVLLIVYGISRHFRSRAVLRFGEPSLVRQLMPSWSSAKGWWRMVLFCLASGDSLWMIIGIGTICNACLNGPLIQFFRTHVTEPLLYGKK